MRLLITSLYVMLSFSRTYLYFSPVRVLKRGMSSKRIRSLTVSHIPPARINEFQHRRTTRLSSRASELPEASLDVGLVPTVNDTAERHDIVEEESPKRSRKRVKLDAEDITDIEDLVYVQRTSQTRSSSQKAVHAKRKLKVAHEERTDPRTSSKVKFIIRRTFLPMKMDLFAVPCNNSSRTSEVAGDIQCH